MSIEIVVKVAISGLNSILPLIGNQLLEYPPLAESYYNLLNSLCEIYTDKVLVLDSNLLSPLLHSLQLGLSQFGNEIAKTVLEAISALSACIYDQIKVSNTIIIAGKYKILQGWWRCARTRDKLNTAIYPSRI